MVIDQIAGCCVGSLTLNYLLSITFSRGALRVRPRRTFDQAAARFILENRQKRSLNDDIGRLKGLMPWIGAAALERIHIGTLQTYIEARRAEKVAAVTINHGLKVVRRILNLAASEWLDEHGLTWLAAAPKIKLLTDHEKRSPYPLDWEEQGRLFPRLPNHLAEMALFAVNTGCRDSEICGLRWEWEHEVRPLGTFVFIIPGQRVKNGDARLVMLNRTAVSVVNAVRGRHPTQVFGFRGKPVAKMLNGAWVRARNAVGLPQVRAALCVPLG